MKKIFSLLVLFALLVQLFLLPAAAVASFSAIVQTLPATNVGADSARLNGIVTAWPVGFNGTGITYISDVPDLAIDGGITSIGYFRYGLHADNLNKQTTQMSVSPTAPTFFRDAKALDPCTKYYIRPLSFSHLYLHGIIMKVAITIA
jgi:hypothetical protein